MKVFEGVVTSIGMNKTVVVEVSRRTPHPLYKKLIKRSKKFKADNTGFENLKVGNSVRIVETKPISKQKYFKVSGLISDKTETIKKDETIVDEKPAIHTATETLKETETQKLSVSKNLSDSVVARKAVAKPVRKVTKTIRVRKESKNKEDNKKL